MLLLIRHSQPEVVPGVSPSVWHLSDEGRRRCQALSDLLRLYHPEQIITSQEVKAIETGAILARWLGIPSQAGEDLHEHVRKPGGVYSRASFEASVAKFFKQPSQLVFGEETADQAYQRYYQAVRALLERYLGKRLAVVSHGTVMSLFICRSNKLGEYDYWSRLSLPALAVLSLPDFRLLETINSKA